MTDAAREGRRRAPPGEAHGFRKLPPDDVAALDPARRLALAELAHACMPEFYDLIPLAHGEVLALVGGLIGAPGNDLAHVHVCERGTELLAFFAELPARNVGAADRERTLRILRRLDRAQRARFMTGLEAHATAVEPLPPQGLYASGLAATPSARGLGLGRVAMRRFLALATGGAAQLHVRADNGVSIALHRKFGFEFLSEAPYTYRVMIRTPQPEQASP